MATKKITELTELTTPAGNDLLILDDVSEVATKKITVDNILAPLSQSLISYVDSTTGAGWATAYEVDFTSLATQNLKVAGDVTIDGKTWNTVNSANAAILSITSSVGLRMQASSNAYSFYQNTRTTPILRVPLTNLATFPTYSHNVRLSIYYSFTPTLNYQYFYFGVENTSSPAGNYRAAAHGFNTSANATNPFNEIVFSNAGTAGSSYKVRANGSTDNMMVVELYRPEENMRFMRGFTGLYSGDWAADNNLTYLGAGGYIPSGIVTLGSTNRYTSDGTSLLMTVSHNTSNTPITVTIYKVKVEYRKNTGIDF